MSSHSPIQIFNTSGISIPIKESDAICISKHIEAHQNCVFELIELVFVDEQEITRINNKFLNHHYVTDVITFRLDDGIDNLAIEGTIYCCAQRISDQASEFNQTQKDEFLRVMIHGFIHLIGYGDKTLEEKKTMTTLEDYFLDLFKKVRFKYKE